MDTRAQAELRRQKILANAEARLRKIRRITLEEVEKVSEKEDSNHLQGVLNVSEEVENDRNMTHLKNDLETKPCLSQPNLVVNGNVCSNGLPKKCDNEPVGNPQQINNFELKRGDDPLLFQDVGNKFFLNQKAKRQLNNDLVFFMFLGMLVRFVCFIGLSSVFLNNILGPFLVVCLPRIILYMRQKPELSMIYSLILFLGIQESRIKMPFRVLSCLRAAVQYLALYLFSFFLTHSVIKELSL